MVDMTARLDKVDRRVSITLRELAMPAAVVALLLWILTVLARGAMLALQAFSIHIGGVFAGNAASSQMLWAAGVVYLTCIIVTIVTRRIAPTWTLPVALAAGGTVVIAGAIGTESLGAFIPALALVAMAWLAGDAILCRMALPPDEPVVRLPFAIALGLGVIGLVLLFLSAFSALNAVSVIACALLAAGGLVTAQREQWRGRIARLRSWRPTAPSWFETVVIGLTVGSVSFALLAAFVPETLQNASDVTRQHLPIIREIWQTGSAAEFPPMGASRQPIQGHLLYSVVYGFGGTTSAKLLQALIALVTIAGVAGIGWLGAGRVAATVGAAVFASVPIAMWVFGHVHADLIATLFAVASTLGILLWQRDGRLVWLAIAGALAGFAFVTKLPLGIFTVALAFGMFLVGRERGQWRNRLIALVAFGAGGIVVLLPWIARSFLLTGTFPGLEKALAQIRQIVPGEWIAATPSNVVDTAVVVPNTGLERAPLALLRGPWDLTFAGATPRYRVIMNGEFGIALLMLMPLAFLKPRTRTTAFLALVATVSFIGWVFTIQVSRHVLPTLAIAAALVGTGVASLLAAPPTFARTTFAPAVQLAVIAGIALSTLFYLPNNTTRLPVDLLLGRESRTEFLEREVPSLQTLAAATAVIPPDTKVGYVGLWEGPQIYTEARLWYFGSYAEDDSTLLDFQLGSTPKAVLATFDQLDMDYIIWNQASTRPEDWQSTLLSGPFLRDHTRILASDQDSYLFEILPSLPAESERIWGMTGPRNLLQNPEFAKMWRQNSPWKVEGKITINDNGALSLRPASSLTQRVRISAGTPYLLDVSGDCQHTGNRFELSLRWLDDHGSSLGVVSEIVRPSINRDGMFVWGIAPDGAKAVLVAVSMAGGGRCELSGIAMYAAA